MITGLLFQKHFENVLQQYKKNLNKQERMPFLCHIMINVLIREYIIFNMHKTKVHISRSSHVNKSEKIKLDL